MQNKLQIPMFTRNPEWVPPSELPDLTDAKEIAVDLETRDPNLKTKGPGWPTRDGEVIGYAVATSFWSGYLPIKHFGGGNLDEKIVKRWLAKQLAAPSDKIMHNAQYDLGWLRAEGFTVNGRVIDTMVTANLLDENRFSYSLNALGYDYLGKVKSEKGLVEAARDFGVDPKAEMWKLPAMYVGQYAEMDATLTLDLWTHFKVLIEQEGIKDIWELETALIPYLVEMTLRGVRVDLERAERSKQEVMKREKALLAQIKDMVGVPVDIWAAASISKAFDALGIAYPRTEKGAPSFTKSFLNENPHPLATSIAQARAYNKINGTFIDGILRHVGARRPRPRTHQPNPLRRRRHRLGPHIHVKPQHATDPVPRSNPRAHDPQPVPARRGQALGVRRLLAAGAAARGPLCRRLWQEHWQGDQRRGRDRARLQHRPEHRLPHDGGADGVSAP
jgi:DNA polymerase I-like protein with 3'-5' exonuclease and polymerase domains